MSDTPNLYGFATKELAQDATIAYILAWADPKYKQCHKRLHALGTELLRALLATQGVALPRIETLAIETQVDRIDIVAQINTDKHANRIVLIIEDKVSTQEHSNQIDRYKCVAEENYKGKYDEMVAVYFKTGNESQFSLPPEDTCGRFLRRDLLDVLDNFQETGNVIVDNFRAHLQLREDVTDGWRCIQHVDWHGRQTEGFYTALEEKFLVGSGWAYTSNASGGFLCWWGGGEKIRIGDGQADIYLQIHDAIRLTIRVGRGDAMDRIDSWFMYRVLNTLECLNEETFDEIRIKKAGRFRGGSTAAVANITFDERCTWLAVDAEGKMDLGECVDRLHRVHDLIGKVAAKLTEDGVLEKS